MEVWKSQRPKGSKRDQYRQTKRDLDRDKRMTDILRGTHVQIQTQRERHF